MKGNLKRFPPSFLPSPLSSHLTRLLKALTAPHRCLSLCRRRCCGASPTVLITCQNECPPPLFTRVVGEGREGAMAEPRLAFAARERRGVTGLPPSCCQHPWQQRRVLILWSHPWSPLRSNNSLINKSNRCAPFIFWAQLVGEVLQTACLFLACSGKG